MVKRRIILVLVLPIVVGCAFWLLFGQSTPEPVVPGMNALESESAEMVVTSAPAGRSKASALEDQAGLANLSSEAPGLDQVLESLSHGQGVLDALDQRAWMEGWPESELGESLAFWMALCGPARSPRNWRWRTVKPLGDDLLEAAERICGLHQGDFEQLANRHDADFLQLFQEGGVDLAIIAERLHDRLQPIELERLIRQLREALADLRFERVRDVVWALHVFDLLGDADETANGFVQPLVSEQPGVSTMVLEAIGTALMCRRLGGCDGAHPLVIRFCSIDPDRPCLAPQNLDDAISDGLRGLEIRQYERLLRQINSGLVRLGH